MKLHLRTLFSTLSHTLPPHTCREGEAVVLDPSPRNRRNACIVLPLSLPSSSHFLAPSPHSQAGAYRNEGQSYWRFLRNSSLAHGLQMEFMRSAPGLWKMARLYRRLMALQGRSLVVRYEDLAATPVQVTV